MENGARQHATFTPWFWSGRMQAKIEAGIVICVFAGVLAIMVFLFNMPGPLVVHFEDDRHEAIKGAKVRCTSPDGATSYAGQTDVFGEAKWPGLAKGPWRCEITPPDRFHAGVQTGVLTVVARHPATWVTSVERPAHLVVKVFRPQGAPRAAPAVRAVCGEVAWESRAGLLDGVANLYLPHGKPCKVGLAFPELPGDGLPTQRNLDCAGQACLDLTGGVGEEFSVDLKPTPEFWSQVRPPAQPDK